ncbi:EAL domain-containing protein [Paenibacillus chungangensis]|uniref:EAL domain-containing protein n=1 Tax=Paenibacillus chungangensis TaxID=696535 RepID=A0ABW3HRA7_9BACL
MKCQSCDKVLPIQDKGIIWIITRSLTSQLQLNKIFMQNQWLAESSDSLKLPLHYTSREQLLEYLHLLIEQLSSEVQTEIQIEFEDESDSVHPSSRFQLATIASRVKHYDLVRIISDNQFASHMQPIVDINNMQIVAYEFLLRPAEGHPPFKPYQLFEVAQQCGLHSFLDRSARISAIETSALVLKKGIKRFINFLPSSIYNPNHCLSHTFHAIDRFQLDPSDFVFEVVETEKISDIAHLKNIFKVYQEHGIQVALDDVGAGYSTLEVLAELKPDYVKIDRDLVSYCDQDNNKQKLISDIITCAQSFGATVLAEGMERPEELAYCKSRQVSLAQGYLLGKPSSSPLADR